MNRTTAAIPAFLLRDGAKRLSNYLSQKDMEDFRLYRNKRYCDTLFQKQVSSRAFSYRRPVGQQMRWVELVIHIFRRMSPRTSTR